MITPTWLSKHFDGVVAMVDSARIDGTPAHKWLEDTLAGLDARPGRPRQLSVRALLVALQLMALDGEFFLKDVPVLLDALSARNRRRLGLWTGCRITERQVLHLYGRICDALRRDFVEGPDQPDESYRDLDRVVSALGTTAVHPATSLSRSVAIDGSDVPTWANPRYVWRRVEDVGPDGALVPVAVGGKHQYEKVWAPSDPDAKRRGAKNPEGKKPFDGYSLTADVAVKDQGGPEVPNSVLALRYRPVTVRDREMGLATVAEVAQLRGEVGDVLIDRGYTNSHHGRDFLNIVRALGGEPVFDLNKRQVGANGAVRGAILIDGRPYCPSLPERLRQIPRPVSEGTGVYKPNPQDVADYEALIREREQWALQPHGQRDVKGSQTFACPAVAGKLLCPLQTARRVRRGALPVLNAPSDPIPGTVCAQRYVTLTMEEVPLYQEHVFGSPEWKASYNRRGGNVERLFSTLKSAAGSCLERGHIRTRGIIKTGLFVAMAVAATNYWIGRAFDARRVAAPRTRRTGRPRRQGLLTYQQVALNVAASRTVNLKT